MTDDRTPVPPGPEPDTGPDDRDEHLAARLAVEPLAAHTRTRLVRRALDEGPTGRRRRLPGGLTGAAAVLAVAVVVTVVVLTTGSSGGGPRRAAVRSPAAAPRAAAGVTTRDLGDVGDVTDPARLRSVFGAPAVVPAGRPDPAVRVCGDLTVTAGLARLDTVGHGLDAGRPVIVAAGVDRAGRRVVVVVAVSSCAVLQRLALG